MGLGLGLGLADLDLGWLCSTISISAWVFAPPISAWVVEPCWFGSADLVLSATMMGHAQPRAGQFLWKV